MEPLTTADLDLESLRRLLEETIRSAGPNSQAARILSRIVRRREAKAGHEAGLTPDDLSVLLEPSRLRPPILAGPGPGEVST